MYRYLENDDLVLAHRTAPTGGKRFELTPWRGRCGDYREVNGGPIPQRLAVTWGLPQGDFEWLRPSIDQTEFS